MPAKRTRVAPARARAKNKKLASPQFFNKILFYNRLFLCIIGRKHENPMSQPQAKRQLQIGPRIEESSRKECNDFMGVMITGTESQKVIIRQFHDLPASLEERKDGKIRVVWGTGSGASLENYKKIHEALRKAECPYVQTMYGIGEDQDLCVWPPSLCVVDAISHNPPTLSSQDEPWFLLMMLQCLEGAHAKYIYHGNITKENISWNLSDGCRDVALANWIDAEQYEQTSGTAEMKDVQRLLKATEEIFVDTGTLTRKLLSKLSTEWKDWPKTEPKDSAAGRLLSVNCIREVLGLKVETAGQAGDTDRKP